MNIFKRILVPLDGSSHAEKAIPFAISLARKFGSQLILMKAVDVFHPTILSPHLSSAMASDLTLAYQTATDEAQEYLHCWAKNVTKKGIDTQVTLYNAQPTEGILKAVVAYKIDLIVMSTHGHDGLVRWTLGSVADKVVRHAPCPVLLVREFEPIDQEINEALDKILVGSDKIVKQP